MVCLAGFFADLSTASRNRRNDRRFLDGALNASHVGGLKS